MMKSTWSGILCLFAALAVLPTRATAADSLPRVLPENAAEIEPQRIVLPVSGQSDLDSAQRSTIGFVNVPSEKAAPAEANRGSSRSPTPVYRRPAPAPSSVSSRRSSQAEQKRVDTTPIQQRATEHPAIAKAAVPRLMSEAYPAQLEERTDPLADDVGELQTLHRPGAKPAGESGNASSSRRVASEPLRLEAVGEAAAPMARTTDKLPERIPPVDDGPAAAPRLLTAAPNDQWAAVLPLAAGVRPETAGPVLKRAPLADRLAALQDQVPSSYVGIEGRVGAINLGDRTVKLNFDRRQPPPLGGLVKVYQVQGRDTTCVGSLKITRVYGGVATGMPVGDLRVNRLASGDVVVFHVGSTVASSNEQDPREAIWVSDRVNLPTR